jgi:hypothetical protein
MDERISGLTRRSEMTDEEIYDLVLEASNTVGRAVLDIVVKEAAKIDPDQLDRIACEIMQIYSISMVETAPPRDPVFKKFWDTGLTRSQVVKKNLS